MDTREEDSPTMAVKNMDTLAIGTCVNGQVTILIGELKGLEGTLVAQRPDGRVLVKVGTGVYVEVPQICVQPLGTTDKDSGPTGAD